MTLRNAKKHGYYPHLVEEDVWRKYNERLFGRDESLEELIDRYDVDEANPETLLGKLAEDHEDEFVVWHDYEQMTSLVIKLG